MMWNVIGSCIGLMLAVLADLVRRYVKAKRQWTKVDDVEASDFELNELSNGH
jgi:hypothetical protein